MFQFYNTFLNLLNISSFFLVEYLFIEQVLVTGSTILFSKNSHALWATFWKQFFKKSTPIFNNCFLYFVADKSNNRPLTCFPVLGSIKYRRIFICY